MEFKTRHPMALTNFLDDYLFVSTSVRTGYFLIRTFLAVCEDLGVPVAEEKTVWPCQVIVFLGMLLDGANRIISIPDEKRLRALNLLNRILSKHRRITETCWLPQFLEQSSLSWTCFHKTNVLQIHGGH